MLDAQDARFEARLGRDPDDLETWVELASHVSRAGRLPGFLGEGRQGPRLQSLLERNPERQDLARLWATLLGLELVPRRAARPGTWWRSRGRLAEAEEHDYDRATGRPLYLREASTGQVFAWIPPGEFWMGAEDGDPRGLPHERPRHLVQLGTGFYMGVTPVTASQFEALMRGRDPPPGPPGPPATGIRWLHAVELAAALGDRGRGLGAAGWGFRLPSEAEWEYACRGGEDGEAPPERLDLLAWHLRNAGGAPRPVGGKGPNPFGLHDMLGNVWEWCLDRFHPDYRGAPSHGEPWYRPEDADQDPDEVGERVLRGGSVKQSPEELTVTARKGRDARLHPRNSTCGVRLVLSPEARPLEGELAGRLRMTTDEALDRLRSLAEIPPDEPLEDEVRELFEAILVHFQDRQDVRCIVPLLEVFQGDPDPDAAPPSLLEPEEDERPEDDRYPLTPGRIWGAMLYAEIHPVLEAHPREDVLEGLRSVLESSDPGLRIRALDLPLFDPALADLYRISLRSRHRDERYLAAIKLQRVCSPEDLAAVREALEDEPEEAVRRILEEILEEHE